MVSPKDMNPDDSADSSSQSNPPEADLNNVIDELRNMLSGLETDNMSTPPPVDPPLKADSQIDVDPSAIDNHAENLNVVPEESANATGNGSLSKPSSPEPPMESSPFEPLPKHPAPQENPSDDEFWDGNVLGWTSNNKPDDAPPQVPLQEPSPEDWLQSQSAETKEHINQIRPDKDNTPELQPEPAAEMKPEPEPLQPEKPVESPVEEKSPALPPDFINPFIPDAPPSEPSAVEPEPSIPASSAPPEDAPIQIPSEPAPTEDSSAGGFSPELPPESELPSDPAPPPETKKPELPPDFINPFNPNEPPPQPEDPVKPAAPVPPVESAQEDQSPADESRKAMNDDPLLNDVFAPTAPKGMEVDPDETLVLPPAAAPTPSAENLTDPFAPDAASPAEEKVPPFPEAPPVPVPDTVESKERPKSQNEDEQFAVGQSNEKPEGLLQMAVFFPEGQEKSGQHFVSNLRKACSNSAQTIDVQAVLIQAWQPDQVDMAAWAKAARLTGADIFYVMSPRNMRNDFRDLPQVAQSEKLKGRLIVLEQVGLRALYADILTELRRMA